MEPLNWRSICSFSQFYVYFLIDVTDQIKSLLTASVVKTGMRSISHKKGRLELTLRGTLSNGYFLKSLQCTEITHRLYLKGSQRMAQVKREEKVLLLKGNCFPGF